MLIEIHFGDGMTSPDANYFCPVCKTSNNTRGEPLFDDRSVALHIAGKARGWCPLHRSWAISKAPHINFKESINKVAEHILWSVVEAREASQNPEPSSPYEQIVSIERRFHSGIRKILSAEFGPDEKEWWVKGVPLQIRQKCAERREEDECQEFSYSYTDILDLQSIIDKNWRLFADIIEKVPEAWPSKKALIRDLKKLNDIRKQVMHL